jgi:post-segregation antitoxin (ccd killing protein)
MSNNIMVGTKRMDARTAASLNVDPAATAAVSAQYRQQQQQQQQQQPAATGRSYLRG